MQYAQAIEWDKVDLWEDAVTLAHETFFDKKL